MSEGHPRAILSKSPRYEMLDVWRGVVCLVVVMEHVGVSLWAGTSEGQGWEGRLRQAIGSALTWNFGSPLFFVMSGYCIASSLDGARRKATAPGEFLLRGLWRIFPTYWAALLGFVVLVSGLDAVGMPGLHNNSVSLQIGSPADLTWAQWLGNLTLTETWRPLVGGGAASVFTRVAWSLCYQEQFYLLCVLALWLFPRRIDLALGIATVAIVAFRVATWDTGAIHRIEGSLPIYWHVFAVGLAVYWRLNWAGSAMAKPGVDLALVALAILRWTVSDVATGASAAFGLLLIGLHRWDRQTAGLSWLGPIRACGRRSFSIYLAHLPVTTVGNALLFEAGVTGYWARAIVMVPVVTLASVGTGWVFHHVVELRFTGLPPLLGFKREVATAPGKALALMAA